MSNPPRLVIRAEGGPQIGVGHLARGLALAQAWSDRRGLAMLRSDSVPPFWAERFEAEGCTIASPSERTGSADWWMVDGYHLRGAAVAPPGARVLVVDDHDGAGTRGRGATVVVDHNLPDSRSAYPEAGHVLAGPRYSLLTRRPEPPAEPRQPRPEVGRIIVVLGGSPSDAVRELGESIVRDPRLAASDVTFLRGTDDAGQAMADADLAIATAGTVSWELCHAGIPAVLVAVARNQRPVADALDRAGAAVHVDPTLDAIADAVVALSGDVDRRRRMARAGRTLVDGCGPRRVVAHMRGGMLTLRDATMDDARPLLEWSNDPVTRAASFSTGPIAWEEHVRWLAGRTTGDTSTGTYIATSPDGGEVGTVRFGRTRPGVAEIGVTVAPARRGQGWGGGLIDAGCRRWQGRHPGDRIEARIKPTNHASVRAFEDADFDEAQGGGTAGADGALHYAREPR